MFLRRTPRFDLPAASDLPHRYLLVANECPPTPGLCRLMAERCQSGPCEMHVIVSRFRRTVLVSDPALGSGDDDASITVDDQQWDVAEARLDSFMRALSDLGQPLSGEILAGNTWRKLRGLLRIERFDEVFVLGSNRSGRWPGRDLASRIERLVGVPVTTVPADALAA